MRSSMLCGLVVVMLLAGCQSSSPRETYSDVNDTFIALVDGLIAAKQAGKFTNEEWNKEIVPLISATSDALDVYSEATKNGVDDQNALTFVRNLLNKLAPYLVRANS